jgi:hypothetical protein
LFDLEEEEMKTKVCQLLKMLVLALIFVLLLTGCGIFSDEPDTPPSETVNPGLPPVIGPEAARDVALAYVRTFHPDAGLSEQAIWFEEEVTPSGLVGSATKQYRYETWVVTVTYPVVAPNDTIYTVSLDNSSTNTSWQGLVDAYGQVMETSFLVGGTSTAQPTTTEVPTATSIPTSTPTPTPVPTNTNTPVPTATPDPNPCNAAKFVEDVTIEDGTTFYPGADFTKIWRLKNVGTCTWSTNYSVVFVDGARMDGNQAQSLPGQVRPGETVDIVMDLKAPKSPGDYQGLWMLRDSGGVLFGLGNIADKPFWVSISVVDFDEGIYGFDFALNYCNATWRSASQRLPCPGFTNSSDGFSTLLAKADLENRHEDEPTLWVHPNDERYGWIEGTYPAYKVENGDVFKAWVGCLHGYDRCNLTFYLDYIDQDNKVHRLGEWIEIYDGEVTKIEVDLTPLDGQSVRFVLGVEANTKNTEDAQGFWFVPRIQ